MRAGTHGVWWGCGGEAIPRAVSLAMQAEQNKEAARRPVAAARALCAAEQPVVLPEREAAARARVVVSRVEGSATPIVDAARAALAIKDGGSAAVTRGKSVADQSMRKVYKMLVERAVTHAKC